MFTKIAVLGLGKVGHLAAELCSRPGSMSQASTRVLFPMRRSPSVPSRLLATLARCARRSPDAEAVLSCLPYAFNKEVASAAHALGLHYFDRPSTRGRRVDEAYPGAPAQSSKANYGAAVPGLRLASSELSARIWRRGLNACARFLGPRVGALPQHPTGFFFSVMPSTGRPRASSTNISTIAK